MVTTSAHAAFFHRTTLAKRIAADLMSEEGTSGLFLTGARRTGKSTFIREDLIPELRSNHGTHVVYVDLWANLAANPGHVIADALRTELSAFDGLVMRAAKGTGLDKIKVGGLEMSLDKIGKGEGETLGKALEVLAKAAKKSVTLVIDEAQHAQTTLEGREALFALKAARDAMNASGGAGFRLLATGSNRDKLATLVEDKDQAFFKADLMPLPPLGDEYLTWFDGRHKIDPRPSINALRASFKAFGYRPEPFRAAYKAATVTSSATTVEGMDEELLKASEASLAHERSNFLKLVNAMDPLDAAVLHIMAQQGEGYQPFGKATREAYRVAMLAATGEDPGDVSSTTAQNALDRLRGAKFVWRSGRGAYYIEDSQHLDWLNASNADASSERAKAKAAIEAAAASGKH